MSPAARRVAAALVLLLTVWLWRRHGADEPALPATIACAPAVTIDGVLHCAAAVGDALERSCPALPRVGPHAPRSGDALVVADGCIRGARIPGPDLVALGVPIELNTASLAELEALPGIGPALARRIAGARPLVRVDDLLRVHGVGTKRLAGLRPHVTVEIPPGLVAGP